MQPGRTRRARSRAVVDRARAHVADDNFEFEFACALQSHSQGYDAFEQARTEFCFGERLRRAGRKQDARTQLRSAVRKFELLGARTLVVLARSELAVSGDVNQRLRRVDTGVLTAQELQVALHVAKGLTNREVASVLFLSPKTIEFHLTRVYRKLDVRSRAELVRVLVAGERREPDDLSSGLPN